MPAVSRSLYPCRMAYIHTLTAPDTPHPHPAAPAEFKERFSEFLAKMNSSGASPKTSSTKPSSSGNVNTFDQFWEAPSRFWQPRVRDMSEAEMDAIMVRQLPTSVVEKLTVLIFTERRRVVILIDLCATYTTIFINQYQLILRNLYNVNMKCAFSPSPHMLAGASRSQLRQALSTSLGPSQIPVRCPTRCQFRSRRVCNL